MVKPLSYKSLINENTILGRWIDYLSTQETPLAYDFWTGMWLLSSIIGRGTKVDRPRAPVYLNWFILLIAESGTTRKSTAVRFARQILHEVCPDDELVTTKLTTTALEDKMHRLTATKGYAHVKICISELVTFLGREASTIQMPGFLTDLYDCPERRSGGGTIGRGEVIVKNAFISFLSASTPSWLIRAINPDVVEGGFTSRTMFIVCEHRKRKIAWPIEAKDESSLRQQIIDDLKKLQAKASTVDNIKLTDGAMKAFTLWYKHRDESKDPFRSSFESREDAHILRLAACLAINDDLWVIDAHHIKKAQLLIHQVKEDGATIFAGTGINDNLILGIDRVRDVLRMAGLDGTTTEAIRAKVRHYIQGQRLQDVLAVMHELKMVQCWQPVEWGGKRKPTFWRGTKLMEMKGATEAVTTSLDPAM